MILLLSHRADPHVSLVGAELDRIGAHWSPVFTDEDVEVSTVVDGTNHSVNVRSSDLDVTVTNSDVVWYRRPLRPPLEELDIDREAQHFAQEQHWYARVGGLRAAGATFVNEPAALRAAEFKPEQLVRAVGHGLSTPRTLVTNDLGSVQRFAAAAGLSDVVVKVVSPGTPLVGPDALQYMVFTQLLPVHHLDASQLRAAPVIVQEPVPKRFEVRAAIIGTAVLACGIWSQDDERTRVDWRHSGLLDVRHAPVTVPPRVADALVALVRSYCLRYAFADLIVTPGGDWIFLEINANGQWGWLQEHGSLPIAELLAEELAGAGE